MTLHEVTQQVFNLTLGHYINGEKFTLSRLENQFRALLRTGEQYMFEICLPDGRWLAKVYRVHTPSGDMYDYYIPDTREQEELLYRELGIERG